MFGLIGLVFGLVFSLVGLSFDISRFTIKWAARVAGYGVVGYLLYELVIGYTQGHEAAKAGTPPATPKAAKRPAPRPAPARSSAAQAPLTGDEKQGVAVHVTDAGGIEHTTRVGRGVIHR